MEIKTASTADMKWNSLLYFPLYVSLFVLPLEIILIELKVTGTIIKKMKLCNKYNVMNMAILHLKKQNQINLDSVYKTHD